MRLLKEVRTQQYTSLNQLKTILHKFAPEISKIVIQNQLDQTNTNSFSLKNVLMLNIRSKHELTCIICCTESLKKYVFCAEQFQLHNLSVTSCAEVYSTLTFMSSYVQQCDLVIPKI